MVASIVVQEVFVLRTRIRLVLPVLSLLFATIALAACGGSGDGASAGKSDEEKRLAFEDCLRDEGLDVETSSDGRTMIRSSVRAGAGGPGRASFGGPDDEDGPFARCREKTGWAPSPPSEAEQARMRDEGLRMARCMREHGVDMADPAPDGRMQLQIRADSPTVRAAMEACGMGGGLGPARAGRAGSGAGGE